MMEPAVLAIKCSLYPQISNHPFVWLNPPSPSCICCIDTRTWYYPINHRRFVPDRTFSLDKKSTVSVVTIYGSTIFSCTKSSPIAVIIFFISLEILYWDVCCQTFFCLGVIVIVHMLSLSFCYMVNPSQDTDTMLW